MKIKQNIILKTKIKKSAFSILELVIIIGVIALLISIAFSYYKISLKNNRDALRIDDISSINVGLNNIFIQDNILPKPINSTNITLSGELINTQGSFQNSLINTNVEFYDPLDLTDYIYTVNNTRDKFQLIGLLENNWNEKNNINYMKRLPYTSGSELGIFLRKEDNEPVQEYIDIDLNDDVEGYIVYINDEKYAVGNNIINQMRFRINPTADCLHILKNGNSNGDGVYSISPKESIEYEVYCDMTTDGGGWTLFYANNGIEESSISESYVEMRNNMFEEKYYDLTNYNEPTLVGIDDYINYTNNGAKEVLIRNLASTEDKWGKIFFDSPNILEWALSEEVLGNRGEKCIELPEGSTWGVIDNLGKVSHNELTQIMSHGGDNWGISHAKYNCNGYIEKNILPHLAFYSANSNKIENRTRSNTIVGGSWGGGNISRYFIR